MDREMPMANNISFRRIAFWYSLTAYASLLAAVGSTLWISPLNEHEPPNWAASLALIATVAAGLAHGVMLWACHHLAFRKDAAYVPRNRHEALDALTAADIDLAGAIESLRGDIRASTLRAGTPEFENRLRALEHDMDSFIVRYRVGRTRMVYRFVLAMAFAMIALFACLFLADFTLERAMGYAAPAYVKLCYTADSLACRVLESVYFSVATFGTVGYGDIAPTSFWPRLVAIVQILTVALVFVFGLNFAITLRETADLWTPESLALALRRVALDAAGDVHDALAQSA